jgi:large subunit ribosomal protein L23
MALFRRKNKKDDKEMIAEAAGTLSSDTEKMKSEKSESIPEKSDQKRAEKKQGRSASMVSESSAYKVLIQPILSEKTTGQEANGQYSFVVSNTATKTQVKKAIEHVYGIVPKKVRTMHVDGKSVRFGRFTGRRKSVKKAIVFLPKGKTIQIHEGV